MARALWTGTISFGLVNIPVKLYRATIAGSAKSLSFHLLHDKCGTRIKNLRWCPHCDEAVEWKNIVKGCEVSKGRYVKVNPSDFDEIQPKDDFAAISIDGFVAISEVDPLYYDRSYYAAPEGSSNAYALLARALSDSGKAAIAQVILRTRSHLAALRPRDGHLVLTTMFYDSEIVAARDVHGLPTPKREGRIDTRQLETALQLIDSMTEKWDPSKYRDEYAGKVEELIKQKVTGGEVTAELPAAPAEGGQVVDLLDALRKSLADRAPARALRRARHTSHRRKSHKKAG